MVELLPDDDELLLVWVATFGLPAAAGALPTPFVPPFGAALLACARANWATGEIVTVSADSEAVSFACGGSNPARSRVRKQQ